MGPPARAEVLAPVPRRCAVCEAPAMVMAVLADHPDHPVPPAGPPLWIGYSFVMVSVRAAPCFPQRNACDSPASPLKLTPSLLGRLRSVPRSLAGGTVRPGRGGAVSSAQPELSSSLQRLFWDDRMGAELKPPWRKQGGVPMRGSISALPGRCNRGQIWNVLGPWGLV